MEPEIVYEDGDMVVINKPAGLIVHGDGKTNEPTVAEWGLKNFPETKDVGEPTRGQQGEEILRSGIVHRLDRETSGVMVIAKTHESFQFLKKQFQSREIKKEYHTFVYGNIKIDKGIIDRPIGRSAKDFRMWSAQRGARGEMREARTEYVVVSRVKIKSEDYSFVHVFPKTGRTHQIRVHFKAINYPLVADSLYAPSTKNNLGFTRLALHSYSITFTKMDGTIQSVVAPYPSDFSHALALLQK